MKFKCGCETSEERDKRKFDEFKAELAHRTSWHSWFAWHPVAFGGGRCVWLEWIERRKTSERYYATWEYR